MRLNCLLGVASVMILAACGGSDGTGPSGPITRLTGEWDVMFTSEPSHCGENAFHGSFGIGISDSVRTDSRVDVAAPWQAGRLNGYYTMDGTIALTLWSEDGSKAATLSAKASSDSTFAGTMKDPRPGFAPIFQSGTCTFQVTGARRPPFIP